MGLEKVMSTLPLLPDQLHNQIPDQLSPRDTQPTTLRGIKKKAKKVRQPGQTHSEALDLVAQSAGYRDFRHAWHELSSAKPQQSQQSQQSPSSRHNIFLSAYWQYFNTVPESYGSETLHIQLSKPLKHLVMSQQLNDTLNLKGFFVESPDHLEMASDAISQERAWRHLSLAALSLQFMDATGLRPATPEKDLQSIELLKGFPSSDHLSLWVDPESTAWIALEEPWRHGEDNTAATIKRNEWVIGHQLHLKTLSWADLFHPSGTEPHLISPSEGLLHKITEDLGKLASIVAVASDLLPWAGTSASYYSQFISPAREASGIPREGRPGHRFGYENGAVGQYRWAGYPLHWRPKVPLSLLDHTTIGNELQCLLISPIPRSAKNMLHAVRCTLENWKYSEYPDAQRDERFHNSYHAGQPSAYSTPKEQIVALEGIVEKLRSGYHDYKPGEALLKDLEAAWASIANGALTSL